MNPVENNWLWMAWTQVWQVTVLILATALILRCTARNRPQLAFALWMVVFVKCITPPLWSSPGGVFCWLQPPQTSLAGDSQGTLAVVVLPADAGAGSSPAESIVQPPTSGAQPPQEASDQWCPAALLAAIWVTGVAAMLGVIGLRWRRLAKLVGRAESSDNAHWQALLANLACRLQIRWPVRLMVMERPVGPAVLGLFRPTVLLPRALIEDKPAEEIELILAHELMHVRRGDPWLALMRSLALSLWWFHPLVWWAGRQASREAERCCDEAVLAELRCSPARYARCLLDILAIKHQLSPVPAFPGVRAIEVTQGRLERIMKIGQGGHRRTPWWCWAVALVAAVAVLPGAAMVTSAGEEPKALQPAASPGANGHQLDAHAVPAVSSPVTPAIGDGVAALGDKTATERIITCTSVDDVVSRIREERGLSESEAKEFLKDAMERLLACPARGPHQGPDSCGVVDWTKDRPGGNDLLIVEATRDGHKRVSDAIKALRKFGAAEIVIEVRFLTIGDKAFQEVLPESTISSLNVDEAGLANSDAVQPASFDRPLGSHEGSRVARAQLLIEKDSPMRFRVVDKEQGEKLIERCQAEKRSNVLQAPKVTVFSGQTAFVSDTSQSPFFVGLTTPVEPNVQQPQIRVVTEGTRLQLRAIADHSGAVHLDFAATFSAIQAVETMSVPRNAGGVETASLARNAGGKADTTIQIPKVATIRLEGGAALKPGQWLLLSGSDITDQMTEISVKADWPLSWIYDLVDEWKHPKPHETYSLIMMLQAEKIESPHSVAAAVRGGGEH